MTPITLQYKRKSRIFMLATYGLWFAITLWLVIAAFGGAIGSSSNAQTVADATNEASAAIFAPETAAKLLALGTTIIIGLIASLIIKDKLRTVIWMADVILSVVLYDRIGMYIVLSTWFVDEYILLKLYNHYHQKYTINKEIDARG